jgi:hypothetical protein
MGADNRFTVRRAAARRRRGFKLADLCVVVAAAALLVGVAVPNVAHRLGNGGSRLKCASNLREIALAGLVYASQNKGQFPRTYHDPGTAGTPALYTGTDSRRRSRRTRTTRRSRGRTT